MENFVGKLQITVIRDLQYLMALSSALEEAPRKVQSSSDEMAKSYILSHVINTNSKMLEPYSLGYLKVNTYL